MPDIKSILANKKRQKELKDNPGSIIVSEVNKLETKIENVEIKVEKVFDEIDGVKQELKKKLESELVLEIDKEELKGDKPIAGIDYPIPQDGKDYVLTEIDKQEIASKIKVPIVNKIIEKTEVIKEQPIITNEIKEIAKTDKPIEIADKLNTLTEKVEKKVIKGLEITLTNLQKSIRERSGKMIHGGGISSLVAGDNITINSNDSSHPIISSTGGDASTRVLKAGDTMTGDLTMHADIVLRSGQRLVFDGV